MSKKWESFGIYYRIKALLIKAFDLESISILS